MLVSRAMKETSARTGWLMPSVAVLTAVLTIACPSVIAHGPLADLARANSALSRAHGRVTNAAE